MANEAKKIDKKQRNEVKLMFAKQIFAVNSQFQIVNVFHFDLALGMRNYIRIIILAGYITFVNSYVRKRFLSKQNITGKYNGMFF